MSLLLFKDCSLIYTSRWWSAKSADETYEDSTLVPWHLCMYVFLSVPPFIFRRTSFNPQVGVPPSPDRNDRSSTVSPNMFTAIPLLRVWRWGGGEEGLEFCNQQRTHYSLPFKNFAYSIKKSIISLKCRHFYIPK